MYRKIYREDLGHVSWQIKSSPTKTVLCDQGKSGTLDDPLYNETIDKMNHGFTSVFDSSDNILGNRSF